MEVKNHFKGIIHCHSNHSYDSIVSVKDIYDFAKNNELDFVILTDHNTINGSLELRDYVKKKNDTKLIVPVAAEYKTELGDVVVIFNKNEIIYKKSFDEFYKSVKLQDAITLLPHPYQSHKELDRLFNVCDLIEIYNPRLSDTKNIEAEKKVFLQKKKYYFGSDAHLKEDYGNVIISIEKKGDLRTSILNGKISLLKKSKTKKINIIKSQMIKGFKQKKIILILKQTLKIIKLILKNELFSKV